MTVEAPITYRVKIGFLYNFLRFAEWPANVLPPGAAFRIAVAADDETYALIARTLDGKVVDGRAITVMRTDYPPGEPPPHLLFITQSARPDSHRLTELYAGAPVLTIGEVDSFARKGGIMNFVLVDEAVRFEVNLQAASRAGLRISSRVSKMAILVRPES